MSGISVVYQQTGFEISVAHLQTLRVTSSFLSGIKRYPIQPFHSKLKRSYTFKITLLQSQFLYPGIDVENKTLNAKILCAYTLPYITAGLYRWYSKQCTPFRYAIVVVPGVSWQGYRLPDGGSDPKARQPQCRWGREGWKGDLKKTLYNTMPLQDMVCVTFVYTWSAEIRADLVFLPGIWNVKLQNARSARKCWGR